MYTFVTFIETKHIVYTLWDIKRVEAEVRKCSVICGVNARASTQFPCVGERQTDLLFSNRQLTSHKQMSDIPCRKG